MSFSEVNSTEDVGSSAWHKDIAKQLRALTGSVEEMAHFKELAEIHQGISEMPKYQYEKTK